MTILPSWAEQYMGKPFEFKGRGPDTFDCWGLVKLVLSEQYGIELPDYEYPDWHSISPTRARAIIDMHIHHGLAHGWTPVLRAERGDLIIFHVGAHKSHIGLMLNAVHMLHAPEGSTSRIERVDTCIWQARIEGIYRHDSNR